MNDIEKRKAEIRAKAEAEIKKAETEAAIIESLPLIPSFVHVYPLYGKIASVRYNPVNKDDAVKIYQAFADKLPLYVCRDKSTVSVKAVPGEKDSEVSEILFYVEIEKHSQSINFAYQTKAGIVRVDIDMGFSPFGSFYVVDRHRTKYYRWEFKAENRLLALHRVANYARVQSYGDMSAPHMIYAGYEDFEVYDVLGVERG